MLLCIRFLREERVGDGPGHGEALDVFFFGVGGRSGVQGVRWMAWGYEGVSLGERGILEGRL